MFGPLLYLYVGSNDVARDLAYYRETLGAERVFDFAHFGTRVAAVRFAEGPLWLIAEHRPAPSVLPIYGVTNLEAAMAELTSRGWVATSDPLGVPNGMAVVFTDPSGNQIALLQNDHPDAMERAYADPQNTHAMRDEGG
ncbi:MAG: VOC family protein [bacterium]